jgi:hypothetical protein
MDENKIGFIMLRHVNSENTNKYWIYSYECIRKYYPDNYILIIDDNSNYEYITNIELYNTIIINSEYHGRGELLPYYYYLHNKFVDTAIIIHDSVFINNQSIIDMNVDKYKSLWDFKHYWDQIEDETNMINLFNDDELLRFYQDKTLWDGCFGGMSIIAHDYLSHINSKYELIQLLDVVLTRHNRCSFERVIGCLLQKEYNTKIKAKSLLGEIHAYCNWGFAINDIDSLKHLPIIKVWTGR